MFAQLCTKRVFYAFVFQPGNVGYKTNGQTVVNHNVDDGDNGYQKAVIQPIQMKHWKIHKSLFFVFTKFLLLIGVAMK